ncbi:MAG: tetratricopeptide repeat protein [Bacteroides sp.]|nr:tetratricopeptide repeat protein [Bacteroides sp.]
MKKVYIVFSFCLFCLCTWAQQEVFTLPELSDTVYAENPDEGKASSVMPTKALADSAYQQGNFTAAIRLYEEILTQGEAAEIYYNLGNSYYKADYIAKAILNYERALLLRPGNEDIRANLEIARNKTIDKVDAIPELFIVAWKNDLVNSMSMDAWARWGIFFFLLWIGSLYLFFFSKKISLKKGGFVSGMVCLLLVIVCNLFAAQQHKVLTHRTHAIVMTPSVTVRSTPSESGTSLFILHEGHKVQIKDNSMREWKEIVLEDGKVGWIAVSDIEVI